MAGHSPPHRHLHLAAGDRLRERDPAVGEHSRQARHRAGPLRFSVGPRALGRFRRRHLSGVEQRAEPYEVRPQALSKERGMILERFKVPAKDQVHVSEAALRRTVTRIFEKLGVSPEDSAEAADVLTMTDLRGVETHGVSNMLRAYVRDYKAGKLDPKPGWHVVRQSPGTAVIDAERRLGIIVGPKAMRLAVEKAKTVGVGVVTVFNSGHFGAIGHYAMQAAEQNMVGVCFTGAGLSVVPTFATKPLLGTNPIALAAPARHEAPMLFDAATSAIAGNKIRLAMRVGSPLLPGWVTDKDGVPIMEEKPVFDRDDFYQAPLGGTREQGSHKGYGFALMAEVLSTVLSGALPTMLVPGSGSKNHFAAYDIEAFTDLEKFKDTMDEMLKTLRTAKPVQGEERVLYPGLSEAEEIVHRRAHGIPLHKEVLQWFAECTGELGVEPLTPMR
ncbi:MAG: malate dehydrogenase [Candidatus Rokuibacteriota bacterium]|nr:MAG: malate dehydrogenase [Candidatus Rokubacteria bacterium]